MRRRDKDTQGLADLEYLVEGGIRGAPTELTPGPATYAPVVDEFQSAMDAKESGASALAELKEGNLGAAGLDGLMAMLAAEKSGLNFKQIYTKFKEIELLGPYNAQIYNFYLGHHLNHLH